MVDGCKKSMTSAGGRPCVVIDLDGTLLKGNSLHELIKFTLAGKVRNVGLKQRFAIGVRLVMRRLKLIHHVDMKYPFHREVEKAIGCEEMAIFVRHIAGMIRPEVLQQVRNLQHEGYMCVLATAAPAFYASELGKRFGFDMCVATGLSAEAGGYVEARGEEKKLRVCNAVSEAGGKIEVVMTDHEDDLPLLRIPDVKRWLVSPTDALCSALKRDGLDFEII